MAMLNNQMVYDGYSWLFMLIPNTQQDNPKYIGTWNTYYTYYSPFLSPIDRKW